MRRNLPVWLLGLTNLPLGVTGAVGLLITPEVLAARHVPEPTIANVTALGLAGTFTFFLVSPVLDVHFSRRTYAIAMSIAAAILTFVAVMSFADVRMLGIWLFLALLVANLNQAAVGGWFGTILPEECDAKLGAWFTVANTAGFGISSILGIMLVHHAPLWVAATVLAIANLLPLLIILAVDPPTGDRSPLRESFGRFGRELLQLPRRSEVRRMFLLLVLPCALSGFGEADRRHRGRWTHPGRHHRQPQRARHRAPRAFTLGLSRDRHCRRIIDSAAAPAAAHASRLYLGVRQSECVAGRGACDRQCSFCPAWARTIQSPRRNMRC